LALITVVEAWAWVFPITYSTLNAALWLRMNFAFKVRKKSRQKLNCDDAVCIVLCLLLEPSSEHRAKSFYRLKAIESKFMLSLPKKPSKFMIHIRFSFPIVRHDAAVESGAGRNVLK
jgi:hypothetical protein